MTTVALLFSFKQYMIIIVIIIILFKSGNMANKHKQKTYRQTGRQYIIRKEKNAIQDV